MVEAVRANGRKILKLYLIPGLLIGGIKLASILAWVITVAFGLTGENYVAGDIIGILLMGFIGAVIAIIGWPMVIFNVLAGSAHPSEVLFFPWVTTL